MAKEPFQLTRREFVAGSATLALAAGRASADERQPARRGTAKEKINVAVVGAGGRGADNINDLADAAVNIVALCDCDTQRAAESFRRYPAAKRYTDWRKMFEAERSIDAVLVATPDHNHAIVSIAAMRLGKHVYCEKPLAHSIWEARQMAKVAAETGVATQMGTQGHAFEGTRAAVEVIGSGAIGDVRELHVWTDRPAGWWPQGIARPRDTAPVPEGLDWDVWLGPAPKRPFHPAYVPFKWRGWWDFGTGAIGDMGIHNLDTAFWALELTAPVSVEVKDCSPAIDSASAQETAPIWSIIELNFPARGAAPPVKMTWYDGGKLPPKDLFHGEPIPTRDGGSLVIGSKGTLLTRTWSGGATANDRFVLLPKKSFQGFNAPAKTIPRVSSHHHEWVAACKGEAKTLSNFGYAAVLTESLLLGNVALRVGKKIEWDSHRMVATGCPEAEQFIRPKFREGWTL